MLRAIEEHSRLRPTAVAIVETDEQGDRIGDLTYDQLNRLVSVRARLIADVVRPGEVVLLSGPNGCSLAAWLFAGLAVGVRVCLASAHSTLHEVEDLARRVGASVLIVSRPEQSAGSGITTIPWESGDAGGIIGQLPGSCSADGSILIQTSGTTAGGKIAWRTSTALDADARNVAGACELKPEDRLLMAIPMTHSYGLDMLLGAMFAGCAVHALASTDPVSLARHLSSNATVFPGVPFAFDLLSRLSPARGQRPRLVFSAGSPLPVQVRQRFEATWGLRVGDLYGASELGTVTFNHPGSHAYAAGSVGTGLSGVSIRVLDPRDASRVMGPGEMGSIAIAAESMFSGYVDGGSAIIDGHWITGDLGRLDDAGRLYLSGRTKLFIDVGGEKINPVEIEAVLASHPGVAECVILPLPESPTITRLRAVFVPRDAQSPPTSEELKLFMRARVSSVRVPRVFEVTHALPRSESGKVLRSRISGVPE